MTDRDSAPATEGGRIPARPNTLAGREFVEEALSSTAPWLRDELVRRIRRIEGSAAVAAVGAFEFPQIDIDRLAKAMDRVEATRGWYRPHRAAAERVAAEYERLVAPPAPAPAEEEKEG